MVSKTLTSVWAFFAFCLLAASAILIAFSVVWMAPNLTLNFVIPGSFLIAGSALGIAYAGTVFTAVFGIIQANHIIRPLSFLTWVLLVDGIGTVGIGSMIWLFTLKEEDNYYARFMGASETIRQQLQDEFSCCGYFFSNDTTVVIGGFCENSAFAASQSSCVFPIIDYADYTLNNIFTSVYGFMAVISGLFLLTLCVINKRIEAERFRRIDEKRGGRGFV